MARTRGGVDGEGWAAGGGFYLMLGLFRLGMSPGSAVHSFKHA